MKLFGTQQSQTVHQENYWMYLKMKEVGWSYTTDLEDGIKQTYTWFLENIENFKQSEINIDLTKKDKIVKSKFRYVIF